MFKTLHLIYSNFWNVFSNDSEINNNFFIKFLNNFGNNWMTVYDISVIKGSMQKVMILYN